jgi:biopolymer transport protein ExbD
MRLPEEPEITPFINVTSLIDVTFSILAFFIISSLFLSQNLGLSVNLPKANSGKPQISQRIFLTIQKDGTIALDGEKILLNQLKGKLLSKQEINKELIVSLQGDEGVEYGKVVQVIDILRQVEGVKLSLATQKGK